MSLPDTAEQAEARRRFADLDAVPVGLAVLDEELRVLFWNRLLEDWTGIDRSRALGSRMADLNPEWGRPHYADRMSVLFGGGPPVLFSPLLHPDIVPQPPGSRRSFHAKATSFQHGGGGWWAFLSVEDVTVLTRRVDELRLLRTRQERLMREIHHRVKNNLNMISGLITLQKNNRELVSADAALDDLQSRIVAISEIHDVLYHSSSLSIESTAGYLETLGRLLDTNLSLSKNHKLVFDLDPTIALKTDTTVLLGLIQAELITNALKYGLTGRADETIRVRFGRPAPGEVEYELSQSGDRPPEGFDPVTSEGLGMVLLTAYASQLGTTLGWSRGDPTRFWLRFKE
jgi:two-component sensor histidine kinase